MIAQFKKGILEMAVLYTVAQGDTYGYELMNTVKAHFPDTYEGTIYTILRRLAQDECVETYEGAASGGPKRKYYKITEKGEKILRDMVNWWQEINNAIKSMGIR